MKRGQMSDDLKSDGNGSPRVVPVANLREYFHDALHGALERQQLAVEDQTEHYVVNLLTLFARSDVLFEQQPGSSDRGTRLKPLVVMLGACVSLTLTLKLHVGPTELVQMTVVSPTGRNEPDG